MTPPTTTATMIGRVALAVDDAASLLASASTHTRSDVFVGATDCVSFAKHCRTPAHTRFVDVVGGSVWYSVALHVVTDWHVVFVDGREENVDPIMHAAHGVSVVGDGRPDTRVPAGQRLQARQGLLVVLVKVPEGHGAHARSIDVLGA